jgi:cell division protein FtsL
MTVRPSLRPPDTTRALQFAATTRPRGSTLSADTHRAISPSLKSSVFAPNPNRGERRWGTVAVDVEMAQRAVEARREVAARESVQRPRKHLSAVSERGVGDGASESVGRGRDAAVAAREAHPAGGSRRQRPVAARRTGIRSPAPRRSGTAARPVAVPVTHSVATNRELASPRRFRSDVATADVRTPGEHSGSPAVPASSVRKLAAGRSVDVGATDGATALAAVPKVRSAARAAEAKRSPVRERRADLRVARPPRIQSTPRQRRLRFGFLVTSAFVLILGVFSSAIALHATLAKNQLVLDEVRAKVTQAERQNQRLRVEVAELEAPAHVIGKASELGLVPADRVTFVSATVPAASAGDPGVDS